jgi:hypothetical protein
VKISAITATITPRSSTCRNYFRMQKMSDQQKWNLGPFLYKEPPGVHAFPHPTIYCAQCGHVAQEVELDIWSVGIWTLNTESWIILRKQLLIILAIALWHKQNVILKVIFLLQALLSQVKTFRLSPQYFRRTFRNDPAERDQTKCKSCPPDWEWGMARDKLHSGGYLMGTTE